MTLGSPELKARPLPFDTFRENVAVLARSNAVLRPERLAGVRRLEVRAGNVTILASPMIADDGGALAQDEIGLPQPAFRGFAFNPATGCGSRRRRRRAAWRRCAPRSAARRWGRTRWRKSSPTSSATGSPTW